MSINFPMPLHEHPTYSVLKKSIRDVDEEKILSTVIYYNNEKPTIDSEDYPHQEKLHGIDRELFDETIQCSKAMLKTSKTNLFWELATDMDKSIADHYKVKIMNLFKGAFLTESQMSRMEGSNYLDVMRRIS